VGNTTHLHQALVLEQDGRFSEALELFLRCLDDPAFDEGDMHFHCGWCLENVSRKQEALHRYAHAAALTRIASCKLNSFFRSGWILMHDRNYLQAGVMLYRAVEYGDLVNLKNETYQHAMYWYAHCLEVQAHYLEALQWYRLVGQLAPQLDPESRFRQIHCLIRIGRFEEALRVCETFDAAPPAAFDDLRYIVLRTEVLNERTMLESALHPGVMLRKGACNVAG
jgi:tetratricopeptide (TPR) repeat protein